MRDFYNQQYKQENMVLGWLGGKEVLKPFIEHSQSHVMVLIDRLSQISGEDTKEDTYVLPTTMNHQRIVE